MEQENGKICHIEAEVPPGALPAWRDLAQRGVWVEGTVGVPVRTFIERELGAEPEYAEATIQTVFLEGHPVDDIDQVLVPDGARMALAASMPGLMGIAMRRKSPGAFVRASITWEAGEGDTQPAPGRVFVLLYNRVMEDLGPGLLARGVLVRANVLLERLLRDPGLTGTGTRLHLDGRTASADGVVEMLASSGERLCGVRVLVARP